MNDIRIAAVIFNSAVNRTRDNLDRMAPWIKQAKDQAAKLICFPELNITGYSTKPEIKDCTESLPGPVSERLVQMANDNQIVILAGLAEKDEKGRIFASHLVVTPNKISGIYRKIHIAPPERSIFSPGNAVSLFEVEGIRLGIQLCYDVHFPELSTRMALDGADVIFMPHASPRGTPREKFDSWMRHLTARAFDNSVFIVACNQNGDNLKGLQFPGVAVVIDPSGDVLKDNVSGQEAMIVADLKADVLAAVRGHRMRYFLPNRRPDLYQ
jgi:N-carbamoylputrescine amidase